MNPGSLSLMTRNGGSVAKNGGSVAQIVDFMTVFKILSVLPDILRLSPDRPICKMKIGRGFRKIDFSVYDFRCQSQVDLCLERLRFSISVS